MLTGTLITVAGFLPIGLAKSAAGEYTFSLFSVNALALVISWVVAVTFTPYLGYVLLKVKPHADGGGEHELFDTPGFRKLPRAGQLVRGIPLDHHRRHAGVCAGRVRFQVHRAVLPGFQPPRADGGDVDAGRHHLCRQ
jgi:multidrug efflux pump subunit AcrB